MSESRRPSSRRSRVTRDDASALEAAQQQLREARDQHVAIRDVLLAISQTKGDIQPVFDTINEHAARLCHATVSFIGLVEGDQFRVVASRNPTPAQADQLERQPLRVDRGTVSGRSVLDLRTVHVRDVQTDPEYGRADLAGAGGYRTSLAVPLLRDGVAIGTLALTRLEVRPFTDREIQLVETFAQQASIAIANVRMFEETREALARQTAISEVLSSISRSVFDLDTVLATITERAMILAHAEGGAMYRRTGEVLTIAALAGAVVLPTSPLGFQQPLNDGPVVGKAILGRRIVAVADARLDPTLPQAGPVTRLAIPIMRDGEAVGAIALGRNSGGAFNQQEIDLVAAFADQAAIAIENVRLFNEIQDKSQQLEAASRHKSEFLANMSHELRTPLNAIIGFSDVLERRMFGELNDRQAEYAHDIASSGRHLLDLVNEILDLSKVEAGRMELEPSAFALAETVRGALAFVRERAVAHSIDLRADLASDVGTVIADERKVRQVLLNLLSNAVKFTPDGGTISVDARCGNGEFQVAVRDSGIGIAAEDQAKVFDEFQQVGKRSDRSREGTGLGLTLAKRFVELHRGRIWVESEVGRGTTFTFVIPQVVRTTSSD